MSAIKHAYLIMAHDNPSILIKLLQLIDDPRHDIFLHIDERLKFDISQFRLRHSHLEIIESRRVYWANYSQVDTELQLLKAASQGNYSYYHLLSGVDLPLKTNDERFQFFESCGKNFIAIVPHESFYSIRRVKYYHLLTRNSAYRRSKPLKAADRLFEYIQRFVGVNRLRNSSWHIIDGWTWFSIRHDLCKALINAEKHFKDMFRFSIAADELFIQTFIYNTLEFRNTLYDENDLKKGSMRYIDWKRGKPYTFGTDQNKDQDYSLLMNSPYMFARKFSEFECGKLVEQIYSSIMEKQVTQREANHK